jgi:hypothetical protein
MKLWIGGELESDIADSFRAARRDIEIAINNVIEANVYPGKLKSWDCIAIVRNDEIYGEICKYSKKTGEMDFRLKLDYMKFKEASQIERCKMLFKMLLRSLAIIKEKNALACDDLLSDVLKVGRNCGWA